MKLVLPSVVLVLFQREKLWSLSTPAVKPRRSIFICPLASIGIGCLDEDVGSEMGDGSMSTRGSGYSACSKRLPGERTETDSTPRYTKVKIHFDGILGGRPSSRFGHYKKIQLPVAIKVPRNDIVYSFVER